MKRRNYGLGAERGLSAFLFLFALGFLLGILIIALVDTGILWEMGILSKDWLLRLKYMEVDGNALFFYCLKKRCLLCLLLVVFACSNLARPVAMGYCLWLGLTAGILLSTSAMQFGVGGPIFYLALIFPQGIFFVAAFIFYLYWMEGVQNLMRFEAKTDKNMFFVKIIQLFVILTMVLLGILLESYVNPILFHKIVKIFV